MTPREQLDKWVAGQSVHNHERDECCPDFSCCQPELLASEEERVMFRDAYINGNQDLIDSMLMMFLTVMLSNIEKDKNIKIYLAGETDIPEV